jgi:tetratricopeptide (TPR) repeat protein
VDVDSPEERLAARYVEMARGLRASGDYEEAAAARRHAHELLTQAAEGPGQGTPSRRRRRLDNDNDLAWLLATRPDPAEDDREQAVDIARRSVEADPDNPAYWNTLGLALCRVGAYEEAQAAARRSMELDESWNGFDLVVLALTDARLGRKSDAAPWLAQAVQWRDDRGLTDPTLNALIRETESVLAS